MIYTNHDLHKMAKVKYSCMLLQTQCFLTHLLYVSGLENKVISGTFQEALLKGPGQLNSVSSSKFSVCLLDNKGLS